MKRMAILAFAGLLAYAAPLWAAPVLITEPDYVDSFTIFAKPRRNPGSPGMVTSGGYPVFSTSGGGIAYIEQRGESLPVPLRLPGFGVSVVVTEPYGNEVPGVESREGRIGLTGKE